MVVNKVCYCYYVIQSSNKDKIEAYEKDKKNGHMHKNWIIKWFKKGINQLIGGPRGLAQNHCLIYISFTQTERGAVQILGEA